MEKRLLGFLPIHSTRVTAQVETNKRGGYRLIVAEGMDLAHTARYASIDEALKGADTYVATAHGELERRSLREPQPIGG